MTGCNADCVWCPYGATQAAASHGRMDEALMHALLDECAARHVRRISPYLMNEPLVDARIWETVRTINRRAPGARVTLTTNGSLLGPEAVREILALGPGLHELAVSVQGTEDAAYRETMRGRLTLGETVENVLALARALRARRAVRPALTVTMVGTRLIDTARALAYWSAQGIAARVTPLDNQGGLVTISPDLPLGVMAVNDPCPRPHKQAYVMWDGDVVVCCTDYRRSVVLGSLRRQSLHDIWNGPAAMEIRRAHIEKDRAALPPLCRDCRIDRPA